jgi:hypothetical protein
MRRICVCFYYFQQRRSYWEFSRIIIIRCYSIVNFRIWMCFLIVYILILSFLSFEINIIFMILLNLVVFNFLNRRKNLSFRTSITTLSKSSRTFFPIHIISQLSIILESIQLILLKNLRFNVCLWNILIILDKLNFLHTLFVFMRNYFLFLIYSASTTLCFLTLVYNWIWNYGRNSVRLTLIIHTRTY